MELETTLHFHRDELLDESLIDQYLTDCLDRLLTKGRVDHAREMLPFIPNVDNTTSRFLLVEMIKVDMALSAEAGELRKIERYIEELGTNLPWAAIPLDLVMEEIQLRRELGEVPDKAEYEERFPQFQSMLVHLGGNSEATSANRKLGAPPEFPIRTQIDDFLLLQLLGKGAFASVYLAQQVSMQRLVALKVSRGTGDESQALAQFDHVNIVRVFDQRNVESLQVHLLYMQFHPGGTLADVVRANRESGAASGRSMLQCIDRNLMHTSQSIPESSTTRAWIETASWPMIVAWLGIQLSKALQDAHLRGVLHRDVKPANVLLSADGIPKLADFNVSFAGAAGRAGAAATFGGSIGYMAPEHLKAINSSSGLVVERVGERADLYSLAVLLWELWQGYRPFAVPKLLGSWSEAVEQQLLSRGQALLEPQRAGGPTEIVLERALREALAYQPEDRPRSGMDLAGKLRLALYPGAAELFTFRPKTWRWRLLKVYPWVASILIILVPNVVGGILNFQYNYHQVMTPSMQKGLERISWIVNLIFFPAGAGLIIYYALSVIRAVESANAGEIVRDEDIENALKIGNRTGILGGSMWLLGGISFPTVFFVFYPEFTVSQAVHLIISSLICGGISMIYPFFGIAMLTSSVYYPAFVQRTVQDPKFDARKKRMIRQCEFYMLVAAILPLLGAALMISHERSERIFVLGAIGAGVLGLLASWFAYRYVVNTWLRMEEVLSATPASTAIRSH